MSKKVYHETTFTPGKLYVISCGDYYKTKPSMYLYGWKSIKPTNVSSFFDKKEELVAIDTVYHLYVLGEQGKISHLVYFDEEIKGHLSCTYHFEEVD